jgi:hypothetical protein
MDVGSATNFLVRLQSTERGEEEEGGKVCYRKHWLVSDIVEFKI